MDNPLIIFLSVLTGLAIGVVIMVIISKAGLNKDQQKKKPMLPPFSPHLLQLSAERFSLAALRRAPPSVQGCS